MFVYRHPHRTGQIVGVFGSRTEARDHCWDVHGFTIFSEEVMEFDLAVPLAVPEPTRRRRSEPAPDTMAGFLALGQ